MTVQENVRITEPRGEAEAQLELHFSMIDSSLHLRPRNIAIVNHTKRVYLTRRSGNKSYRHLP